MIERNGYDCKYVEIFTHCVFSIGAPSRTVFIRGTNQIIIIIILLNNIVCPINEVLNSTEHALRIVISKYFNLRCFMIQLD
jgi:hypothetical protein